MCRFLLIFSFSLLLGACAQRVDVLEQNLAELDDRLSTVESQKGITPAGGASSIRERKQAELQTQVRANRNDILVSQGKIESLEFELSEAKKAVSELRAALVEMKSQKSRSSSSSNSLNSSELYEKALRAHQEGRFEDSRAHFQDYIGRFADDPLADNAAFWVAESYFEEKAFREALVRFQDLIEKFPKSDKRCEAMQRQVDSFDALGLVEEAKAYADLRTKECRKNNNR